MKGKQKLIAVLNALTDREAQKPRGQEKPLALANALYRFDGKRRFQLPMKRQEKKK